MQQTLFGPNDYDPSPSADARADAFEPRPMAGPRAPLRLAVLGSGSSGNAVVVEYGERRLLIDAGFSCRQLELRMSAVGIDPGTLDAVVITHEHSDHCKGLDRFFKRHQTPIHATPGTLSGLPVGDEARAACHTIHSGETGSIGGFTVEPFLVPHDAREPVGLVLEDEHGRRVGLASDLGSRSRLAWGRLRNLDLLVLETNHDLDMLRSGPYPWRLKQRVAGNHGHLSNRDAAEGLAELISERLDWVVLYHLSRTNNAPALAAAVMSEALEKEGSTAQVAVSAQDRPTDWLEIA